MNAMNKSLVWIGIGAIVVVAIAYFAFMQSPAPTTETPNDTGSQGKLNIVAICEGALAYMTFENGAEADVFVQECKEGKHPEVIEEFKVQMGIYEDRAI